MPIRLMVQRQHGARQAALRITIPTTATALAVQYAKYLAAAAIAAEETVTILLPLHHLTGHPEPTLLLHPLTPLTAVRAAAAAAAAAAVVVVAVEAVAAEVVVA